ncbi:MAG: hypothetical protein Q7T18_12495, partial [Sedimentisphaerales bacterium]|nr:hypothetical protein [Sedimentisphaerales bacterium]
MAKAMLRTGKIAFSVMVPVVFIALCFYSWKMARAAHAQDAMAIADKTSAVPEPNKTEIVSERNENTRLWEITKKQEVIDPITKKPNIVEVKSYIREKGCGICYLDEQDKWQTTDTSWRRTATGFVMDKANYALTIGITSGSMLNYDIDGKRMQLRPASIEADDGINRVVLAELNPAAEGQINSADPSKLVYKNAFGKGIDLEFIAQPDGYHQNIILNEQLVLPKGINVKTAKLHVTTEIDLDGYERSSSLPVQLEIQKDTAENDKTGKTNMTVATEKTAISNLTQTTPTRDDIRFVIQEANESYTSHAFAQSQILHSPSVGLAAELTVADKQIIRDGKSGKTYLVESMDANTLATASYPVTWDYRNVSGTITSNQDWYADATYYVSANLTLGANVTLKIEPGTIVKFRAGVSAGLNVNNVGGGKLIAKGEPYSYIVFTSARDPNFGEAIDSTAPAAGNWSGISNVGDGSGVEFCKIGYASTGVAFATSSQPATAAVSNNILFKNTTGISFIDSTWPVYTNVVTYTVFNNLIVGSSYGISQFSGNSNAHLIITNNTIIGQGTSSIGISYDYYALSAHNNLIVSCGYGTNGDYLNGMGNNAFYNCTQLYRWNYNNPTDITLTASPFDSANTQLGRYFLNTDLNGGDRIKNAGDADVATYYDQNKWSIYPVSDADHLFTTTTTFTTDKTWQPNYTTCDSGNVAIGYHHPRVDYATNQFITANGTLT